MIALLLAWLLASPAEAASCSGPACGDGSVRLTTFSGCVRPHEITRYEANYVK
jgi:hypothetical protein